LTRNAPFLPEVGGVGFASLGTINFVGSVLTGLLLAPVFVPVPVEPEDEPVVLPVLPLPYEPDDPLVPVDPVFPDEFPLELPDELLPPPVTPVVLFLPEEPAPLAPVPLLPELPDSSESAGVTSLKTRSVQLTEKIPRKVTKSGPITLFGRCMQSSLHFCMPC
jgi:hypothetical protein